MNQMKKIFIAGATGVLGMPLTRALVGKNYEVFGLTRFHEKRQLLEQAGAAAVTADALDAPALEKALQSAAPDAVIDLLTAIPKNGPLRAQDMRATNKLRVEGTANLLKACAAASVKRVVAESMTFAYGFGDHGGDVKTEQDPLQTKEAAGWLQEIVDSLRSLENQLLAAHTKGGIEAISLRFGLFYGPESLSSTYMVGMLKKRLMPVISGADGVASWIHTQDAVRAVIAALENGRSGEIYNIVDDEPASLNDMILCMADLLGAKPPITIPIWLMRMTMPYVAVFSSARLRVSNEKAKRELNWQPQFPSYRDGLRRMIADMGEQVYYR